MEKPTVGWFTWLWECCNRRAPYSHYAMNYGRLDRTTDVVKLTREQYEQVNALFHTQH